MNTNRLNRRDLLLMSSGAAALCVGRLADGMLPSAASGRPAELQQAVQRLTSVPAAFGAWTSVPGTISDREQRAASIHGYIRRDYTNSDSGYRVGMTLLCGPAGPMAVHPPTACFEGVGYEPLAGPATTTLRREDIVAADSDRPHFDEFNKSTFRMDVSAVAQAVRVFWGWSTDGIWAAPARPRVAFRGVPWLYKLYVTDQSTLRTGSPMVPQAEAFLKEVRSVLRTCLWPSDSAGDEVLTSRPEQMSRDARMLRPGVTS